MTQHSHGGKRLSDSEITHIEKLLREGLKVSIIKTRTGRAYKTIKDIRDQLETRKPESIQV